MQMSIDYVQIMCMEEADLGYDYFEERADVKKTKTRPRWAGSLFAESIAGLPSLVICLCNISAFLCHRGYVQVVHARSGNSFSPNFPSIVMLLLSTNTQHRQVLRMVSNSA